MASFRGFELAPFRHSIRTHPQSAQMSWKNISSQFSSLSGNLANSMQGIDLSGTSSKLTKGLSELQQSVKESIGRADEDAVTELPEEYKTLERRCDALRLAHQNLLKITKVYATETYDYPTNINESLGELGANVSHSVTFWAAQATKGTNLPKVEPTDKPIEQKKTLAHALSRAAASGSLELTASPAGGDPSGSQGDIRLGKVLQTYAVAQDKIGRARLAQDSAITNNFSKPWNTTLNTQISAAMRARASVKSARLSLDASRAKYKALGAVAGGGGQKREQARLDVEAAEEALVTATEEAINLMRAVLDDPEPVKSISALVKAQLDYHARASEALDQIMQGVQEAGVQAEVEYRKSRT
ncbi:MAG: hypothetical protein CYPHOPRED_005746 [Cyphobasidiales sp. Tagirdzhanova-0007]|nr:MAG: hypothetical protein CYPHOPRED_005746 [Cyphobasidiales sp. Tagirdzhanova-0007]